MPISKIAIDRLLPGVYGWQMFSEQEIMDEDYGDHSVEECLENAVGDLSPRFTLIEILYCGIHMGTVSTENIRLCARNTADQITALYSALVDTA